MRKEELRTYIENHESEMIEDLKSLIRIPSEKQAAEPGKPFGAPAAEALAQGIEILEKYGFAVTNYDNYAIAAKKIISLLREGDSLVCPVENHKVHLFFKFMNRICKARLGNVQPVCRLCDGSHLRYGYHIS